MATARTPASPPSVAAVKGRARGRTATEKKNSKKRARRPALSRYEIERRQKAMAALTAYETLAEKVEDRSEEEREEHAKRGFEDLDCLRTALRVFVRRHFPAAQSACIIVATVPGLPPLVIPMAGRDVPDGTPATASGSPTPAGRR